MLQSVQQLVVVFILIASTAAASDSHRPATSHLLPLVPPNAQVVSGIADPGNGSTSGRLLAATADNNRDLAEFLALNGSNSSDGDSAIREAIVVASSSALGDLSQHLLLVAARFDKNRIRQAALARGAQTIAYSGQQLLAFPSVVMNANRESEVRWIAILHNKIALVGTPALVTAAIDRWQQNKPADPSLLHRLANLPSDVNSWSTIAMPSPVLATHLPFLALHSPLLAALRSADEVELGIHYGSMARIDFSIHQPSKSQGTLSLAVPQTVPSAFTVSVNSLLDLQGGDHDDRIHGSVTVSGEKLNAWLAAWSQFRTQHSKLTIGGH